MLKINADFGTEGGAPPFPLEPPKTEAKQPGFTRLSAKGLDMKGYKVGAVVAAVTKEKVLNALKYDIIQVTDTDVTLALKHENASDAADPKKKKRELQTFSCGQVLDKFEVLPEEKPIFRFSLDGMDGTSNPDAAADARITELKFGLNALNEKYDSATKKLVEVQLKPRGVYAKKDVAAKEITLVPMTTLVTNAGDKTIPANTCSLGRYEHPTTGKNMHMYLMARQTMPPDPNATVPAGKKVTPLVYAFWNVRPSPDSGAINLIVEEEEVVVTATCNAKSKQTANVKFPVLRNSIPLKAGDELFITDAMKKCIILPSAASKKRSLEDAPREGVAADKQPKGKAKKGGKAGQAKAKVKAKGKAKASS